MFLTTNFCLNILSWILGLLLCRNQHHECDSRSTFFGKSWFFLWTAFPCWGSKPHQITTFLWFLWSQGTTSRVYMQFCLSSHSIFFSPPNSGVSRWRRRIFKNISIWWHHCFIPTMHKLICFSDTPERFPWASMTYSTWKILEYTWLMGGIDVANIRKSALFD